MPRPRIRPGLLTAAVLVAALAAVVFLMPGNLVIGASDTDITRQFLAWRDFAVQSVLAGHLPLWNPYTYSGQPFLGDFQSALLYPPNVIFLFLPLVRAANLSLLMHLVIMGWGMHRLASRRGLHPLAAWLCGALLPLSGAVFPHLYAGHLSNLCSMAWTPWVFAGLEDFHRNRRFQGLLLASAAVCLQILAGHPQYVFYTAVAAGLHALLCSVAEPSVRKRAVPAVIGIYIAAAALSAAQLLPGLAGAEESIRNTKLGLGFTSMFSFPPENLLTLIAPGFFGDLAGHAYWGRGYLWEMSVFIGASGMVLAATALLDPEHKRAARLDLGMTALLLLFAAGSNTPLFELLYNYVPGFALFRGTSKFTYPALMFIVMAAGGGADALIRGRVPRPALPLGVLLAGVAAGIAGLELTARPELLARCLAAIQKTRESYLPARTFADRAFINDVGAHAGWSLVLAGGVLILAGAALLCAPRKPFLRWVPLVLLPLEVIGFARTHFAAVDVGYVLPKALVQFVASRPGDYRVLDPLRLNNGFLLGKPDIWGNDPGPLGRYAEFITFTQGGDPDQLSQNVEFNDFPAVYTMLRFRYAFLPSATGLQVLQQVEKPMALAQLVSDYRVIRGRNPMLTALADPTFDPRRTVLLESEPLPRPVPSDNPGEVRILRATPDSLRLEADVASPALLLITDLYSRDWHARPLGDSVQKSYDILPANYVLRAIPLVPGHHEMLVEYVPRGLRLGAGVSILAWLLWLIFAFRLRKSPHPAQ